MKPVGLRRSSDASEAGPVPDRSREDLAYWRAREAEERAQAAAASCMARTAHEDMADDYADLIARSAPAKA